jgi:hypothetical protein
MSFCLTSRVIVSILSNIFFSKLSGIKKPYDVLPSFLAKFNITLVSSGCLDKISILLYVSFAKSSIAFWVRFVSKVKIRYPLPVLVCNILVSK